MTASPSSLAPVVAQLAQIAAAGKLAGSAAAPATPVAAAAASAGGNGSTASGFAEALRAASLRQQATDAQTVAQVTAEAVTDAAALAGLVMPWTIPLVPAIAAGADALATAADAIADATAAPTGGGFAGTGRLGDPGLPPVPDATAALVRTTGPEAPGPAPAALDIAALAATAVAVEQTTAPAPLPETTPAFDARVANLPPAAAAPLPPADAAASGLAAELAAVPALPGLAGTAPPAAEPDPNALPAASASPRPPAGLAAAIAATETRPAAGSSAAGADVAAAAELETRKSDAAIAASPAAVTAPMAPAAREPATLVQAIVTQVAAPGWNEAVAQRLADFVAVRAGDAEIRLNPAHLGPVGVEISYKGNEASVLITAAQPATRDALEQALPQLRELLAQQGIALGQANVRDPGSGNAWAGSAPGTGPDRPARGDGEAAPSAPPPAARATRLVDTFA